MLIALPVQTGKTTQGEINMNQYNLEDAVMILHNIARTIEQQIGVGALAQDIRKCADTLHVITSPLNTSVK